MHLLISDLRSPHATSGTKTKRGLLFCLLLCIWGATVLAQSPGELRQKRQRLLRELEQTTQELDRTREQKSAAIEQIALLRRQIQQRQELISTIRKEIQLTDISIERTDAVINSLTVDIDRLKNEYSEMLRAAYRNKLTDGWMQFLLSSENFNTAVRRWQYLRQYHRYREKQAALIEETQEMLRVKREQMANRREEKEALLAVTTSQGSELRRAIADQNTLVAQLSSSEGDLLAKIDEQKRAHERLNQSIESAIVSNMSDRRRADRQSSAVGSNISPVAAAPTFAENFSSAQGQLQWPARGAITKKFGRQPHPEVPSVEINNSGIDIDAGADVVVASVFDGEVITTKFVPGYRHTVLLRHGDYFTVYSNLEALEVQTGQQVRAGQALGRTRLDGFPLHFEVWRKKERLNPEGWLQAM